MRGRRSLMAGIWRRNSLSIVLLALFITFWAGQSVAGWRVEVQDLEEHGRAAIGYGAYLTSGGFLEATAENWESEFLQMAAYVFLTVFLRQKGSSESKKVEGKEEVDADPREERNNPRAPWPVRRGGPVILKLYENSLGLAFVLLFLVSFFLHARGGVSDFNEEQMLHGSPPISLGEYLVSSRFWFESLQNWQSEFLAVGSIVVLSIFLRQRGSPESKPVATPHSETGA
jgi:hypothetical protein